jgi:hypothetical protein
VIRLSRRVAAHERRGRSLRVVATPLAGRRPRLAVIATIAAALVAAATGACGKDGASPDSTEAANEALVRAADVADRLSTGAGYPFPTSLASQLHLRDPETVYEPLSSPAHVPSRAAIGVYTTASTLWLKMRAFGGLVVELRRVNRGPARATYGPAATTPSGLSNGDFVTPIDETWTMHMGRIARVARDRAVAAATPGSLRIDGTGKRDRTPTLVYQSVRPLNSRGAGTVYTVNLVARTRQLSRPLAVEIKLAYQDGSYDFFVATPHGRHGAAIGVPAASSADWFPLESRAVARKRVRELTVYAVDTGVTQLRGTAWIDDVTLAIRTP